MITIDLIKKAEFDISIGNESLKLDVQRFVSLLSSSSDILYTSFDCQTWKTRKLPVTGTWGAICFGDNKFIAVPNNGYDKGILSYDGKSWETFNILNKPWTSICWSSKLLLFVAVSSSNAIVSSTDGKNWTSKNTPVGSSAAWNSIIWNSTLNLFIAVATKNSLTESIMTSTDGEIWTLRSKAEAVPLFGIACNSSGLNVAVGGLGSSSKVFTSSNGINWVGNTTSGNQQWVSVCYNKILDKFISVGLNSAPNINSHNSNNGLVWNDVDTLINSILGQVIYGYGIVVAITAGSGLSKIGITTDGLSWQIIDTPDILYKICTSDI